MRHPSSYPPEKTGSGCYHSSDGYTQYRQPSGISEHGVSPSLVDPPPMYIQVEEAQRGQSSGSGSHSALQATTSGTSQQSPSPSFSASTGMKKKFMGNTASDMFESLPPCFSRPPPHHELMALPFPAVSHISMEPSLAKGFPVVFPPSPCQPHPFVVHDVREEDWARLLDDIKVVSRLSGKDRVISNVAPMMLGIGLLPSILLVHVIEKNMKKKKVSVVADIIDHWNHYFFHPRLIRVTLAQGRVVYAGEPGPPPDMPHLRPSSSRNEPESYINVNEEVLDHPESSEDEDDRGRQNGHRHDERKAGKQERRQGRDEWRQEKDQRRHDRRRKKQAMKEASKEKWRLIVSFRSQSVHVN